MSDSKSCKAWALIEFVSWGCASEGKLANTISGKFAEVQYFRRLRLGVELPAMPRPLTGVFRYASRGGNPHSHVGPGGKRVVTESVCLSYFLMMGSNEVFAADSGAVHPVHCLTRGDVAVVFPLRAHSWETWQGISRTR